METTLTDLHERIKVATQVKEPGKILMPTLKDPAPAKPAAAPLKSSPAWNSDNDFTPEKAPEKSAEQTQPGQAPTAAGIKTPSAREMKGSARQAVGMYDMTQRMIFHGLAKKKFKNSITKDQALKIDEIDLKPDADLDEEEKRLKKFWEKQEKKFEKQLAAIPLTDQEKADFEDVAMIYQEETGKTLPKWLYGLFAVLNSAGKRTMDIYMLD